jgi:hypothetical protein
MPRTPRQRALRAGGPPARGPSERWLRALIGSAPAARRFFDPDWYLVRHPDLLSAGVDPVAHYAAHGAREGRDPSPFVSARWYADRVPEVAGGRTSVVEHLVATGDAEGRATSPFVDLDWYRRASPDLEESGLTPLEHLMTVGLRERRSPSPYLDLAGYAAAQPDVERSGLDPFLHFVTVGHGLGWWPHPLWREQDYVLANPYVRFALAMGKARSGFEHFCAIGHEQAARGDVVVSYVVDGIVHEHVEARHLAAHPDVAEAVAAGRYRHGIEHLFADGHRELASGSRTIGVEGPPRASATHRGVHAGADTDLVVLFAHHDRDRDLDEHVVRALTALVDAGAAVHLVTTGLDDAGLARALPLVASVIVKAENASTLDFGSWSLAATTLGAEALARPRWVVLANDSSYFPVRDPSALLAHLRASTADVWAATDSLSWDRHHLQSYFLALGPAARGVLLPAIARRIATHSGLSKTGLVQRFEVGLTRDAIEAGLTVDVFRSARDVLAEPERVGLARHRPDHPTAVVITNLTHHLWRGMLREHGLPFLKVELLRDNPLEVDVAGWEQELDPSWVGTIERHLARVRRTTE